MGRQKYNFGNFHLLSALYPVHHEVKRNAELQTKFRIICSGLSFEELSKARTVFTLSAMHVKESTFAENGQDCKIWV